MQVIDVKRCMRCGHLFHPDREGECTTCGGRLNTEQLTIRELERMDKDDQRE